MSAILGIVRGHKGAIMVSSQPGGGSTIRVLFPVWQGGREVRAEERAASPGPTASLGRYGRILVVDDEDLVRSVARRMLERDGWTVLEAANGADAIELFAREAHRLDCVVLDLSMPGMDGLAVFDDLRAIHPDAAVILMSGFVQDRGPDVAGRVSPAGLPAEAVFGPGSAKRTGPRVDRPRAVNTPTTFAACVGRVLLVTLCAGGSAWSQSASGPSSLADQARTLATTDPATAIRLCDQALAQLPASGDLRAELPLRATLAEAHATQGDSPAARDAAIRWREVALRQGSVADKAAANIHLGWFHTRVAEFDDGLARFVEALGPDGLAAHPQLRAAALHGIGRVHATREAPDKALQPLEEARRLFAEVGDQEGRAEVTGALGVVSGLKKDLVAARAYFSEALAAFQKLGKPRKELVTLINLAVVRDSNGDSSGALDDFQRALVLAHRLQSPPDVALAQLNIGETLLKLKRPGEAVPHLQQSLTLSREQHARQVECWSHEDLSLAYEQLGQFARALEHAREFRTLNEAMFNETSEARFAEMETRYRTEARERENERLRGENAVQQADLRRNRAVRVALAAVLAAVSVALAGLVIWRFVVRRHNRLLTERNNLISRQKSELESLRDQLEERVARRTEQLARVNQDLRDEIAQRRLLEAEKDGLQARYLQAQKMEAVGLLAGGVAHDFNNVLTGIGMSCELALAEVPADGSTGAALRDILDLTHRAAHLTRQLLAFSRKQLLQPTTVHVHELVEHSLRMITRIIGEDIRVRFNRRADRDTVQADTAHIEQVLINLAVNARDAMPGGGVLLLETENETLAEALPLASDECLPAGDYVVLRVTDNGTGMDAHTLQRIFEPFFTTKPATRGTGLGLSTVYGVVRQHQGTVRVTSQLGVGTTFDVLLPLSRTPDIVTPGPSTVEVLPESPASVRIMVLEDDDTIRDLVQRLLIRQGYEVVAACEPREAEAVLDQHGSSIRLLISDVILPDRNGPEFFRHVVAPRYPDMRVIFISGYSDQDTLQAEVVRSGRMFLPKPFTPAQLLQAVNTALTAP